MSEPATGAITPPRKCSYIRAPACYALELACKQVRDAFALKGEGRISGVYIVGSAIERQDWRDVDVRLMLDDVSFTELFPDAIIDTGAAVWEFDPRWTLLTVAVTEWMRKATGLPIDFQIQPMTWANEKHSGPRHAAGLTYISRRDLADREGVVVAFDPQLVTGRGCALPRRVTPLCVERVDEWPRMTK